MAWITIDAFKKTFRFAEAAKNESVQMAFDAAEDELYDLLQDALVDDAKLDPPVEPSAARIIRGHSYLALSLHLLNVRELKKTQAEASPATAQTIQTEYYTPKELRELSDQWRARALGTIGSLIDVPPETVTPEPDYTHTVPVGFIF